METGNAVDDTRLVTSLDASGLVGSGQFTPHSFAHQRELDAQEVTINLDIVLSDQPQEGPKRNKRIRIKTLNGRPMSDWMFKLVFITNLGPMKKSITKKSRS